MNLNYSKIQASNVGAPLKVVKGHFATSYSHSNYYIDVAAQKSRYSEAKAVAEELCSAYNYDTTIVDTILCLDGMEVVGTCLANQLTKHSFTNINAHQTIYVVPIFAPKRTQIVLLKVISPEFTRPTSITVVADDD